MTEVMSMRGCHRGCGGQGTDEGPANLNVWGGGAGFMRGGRILAGRSPRRREAGVRLGRHVACAPCLPRGRSSRALWGGLSAARLGQEEAGSPGEAVELTGSAGRQQGLRGPGGRVAASGFRRSPALAAAPHTLTAFPPCSPRSPDQLQDREQQLHADHVRVNT